MKGVVDNMDNSFVIESFIEYCDDMMIDTPAHESVNLYRVTYNGNGIYDEFRKAVNDETWKSFLTSNAVKWLPKPPDGIYRNNKTDYIYNSYFTQDGFDTFNLKTLPIIKKYLDKDKIVKSIVNYNDIKKTQHIVYNDKYQIIAGTVRNSKESVYDPPYSAKQIKEIYGISTYKKLASDPAHYYRMTSGIELIHREPTKEELIRIWNNWNLMSDSDKTKSDKVSMKLFGMTNKDHFYRLMQEY